MLGTTVCSRMRHPQRLFSGVFRSCDFQGVKGKFSGWEQISWLNAPGGANVSPTVYPNIRSCVIVLLKLSITAVSIVPNLVELCQNYAKVHKPCS